MPYVRVRWQAQATGYFCGPAVVRMVLSTFDITPLPSQHDLAVHCGTTAEDGTSRAGMERGLRAALGQASYAVRSMTGDPREHDVFRADIGFALALGHPLPVNLVVRPGGRRPPSWPVRRTGADHWVAVVGSSGGDQFLVCDPASGRTGFAPRPVYPVPAPTLIALLEKTYLALSPAASAR